MQILSFLLGQLFASIDFLHDVVQLFVAFLIIVLVAVKAAAGFFQRFLGGADPFVQRFFVAGVIAALLFKIPLRLHFMV